MIYRFDFNGKSFDVIEQFSKFAETLKSTAFIKVDWIRRASNAGFIQNGYVDIMCSRKDYEELFYWLGVRNIRINIKPLIRKDIN